MPAPIEDSSTRGPRQGAVEDTHMAKSPLMQQPVQVALIGTGAVTAYHHLPGLRLDPRCELAAICDADPDILRRRQADWGVEHTTTEPEELWESDAVDAVVIATPNDTHRAIAVAAA